MGGDDWTAAEVVDSDAEQDIEELCGNVTRESRSDRAFQPESRLQFFSWRGNAYFTELLIE